MPPVGDFRGSRRVASKERAARALRQGYHPAGEVGEPPVVAAGEPDGKKERAGNRPRGGEVGQIHRQRLVPHVLGVGVGEKVRPQGRHVAGHRDAAAADVDQRAVVPRTLARPRAEGRMREELFDDLKFTALGHNPSLLSLEKGRPVFGRPFFKTFGGRASRPDGRQDAGVSAPTSSFLTSRATRSRTAFVKR